MVLNLDDKIKLCNRTINDIKRIKRIERYDISIYHNTVETVLYLIKQFYKEDKNVKLIFQDMLKNCNLPLWWKLPGYICGIENLRRLWVYNYVKKQILINPNYDNIYWNAMYVIFDNLLNK